MDNKRIVRSAGVVGLWTLASRGLGLVRDVLMAGYFATSLSMSAFVVAFTIPNLFRRLFGEGALSAAFVPVFVETRAREGDASAWRLAGRIIGLLTTILLAITLLLMALASAWISLGDPGEKTMLILSLARIMLPYMVFICLAALSMGILNSFHHFAVPAATPVMLNMVTIAALVYVVPRVDGDSSDRIVIMAWAVLLAGVVQLLMQLPVLMRYGYRLQPPGGWRDEKVRRVLVLMGPAALGLAVTQVNVLIDRILAAWVAPWAPAALFFSERLVYFPLGIFATAMGTVLLPVMSGHAARKSADRTLSAFNYALRMLMFVMIPASVGLLVLARPIVEMIFGWRSFGATSIDPTAVALQFYAPGLLLFSLNKVLVPVFYGHQDTRTPVRIGLWAVGINFALNLLFVLTWPPPLKHAGLAFATVLAAAANGGILAAILHRRWGSPGWREIGVSAVRSLGAAMLMGGAVVAAHRALYTWLRVTELPGKMQEIVAALVAIGMGVVLYFVLHLIFRSPEVRAIRRAMMRQTERAI